MIAPKGETAQYGRKMKSSDYRMVPHRWMVVLDLHLAGKKVSEIQQITAYSPAMIYRILDDERITALRQQKLEYYDKEFLALQPKVNDAVRKGLDSEDKYLEAASLWLKHSGKGLSQGEGQQLNVTAENVAIQLLQQASEGDSK